MLEKHWQSEKGTITYWTNETEPDRLTLVFLPGLTADHHLFDKQVEAFKDNYNVIVWDAPGHGKSRPFDLTFSLADKADYLHKILSAEKVTKPIIVGQSMGGYVGQCYMNQFPDSLSGFVSIDSAPLKRKYVTAIEIWLLKRTGPIYRIYPWKLLKLDGSKGVAMTEYGQRLMLDMMNTYSKDEYCKLAAHGYEILAEAMELDCPYEIDCPCLLLCGENDKAGSAKRYNRNWAREEGLPLLWIKNAGHNSNTDNPETVNKMLEEFISQIGSPGILVC